MHRSQNTTLRLLHSAPPPHSLTYAATAAADDMFDVENFEEIFEDLSYSKGLLEDIQENQSFLKSPTFFERLLQLLKIRGQSPPLRSPCFLLASFLHYPRMIIPLTAF